MPSSRQTTRLSWDLRGRDESGGEGGGGGQGARGKKMRKGGRGEEEEKITCKSKGGECGETKIGG